jgi:hypothetical protein
MTAKRFLIGTTIGLIVVISLVTQISGNPSEALAIQSSPIMPELVSFAVGIETAVLDKDAQGSILPPRAVVTTKIQVSNLAMDEKRDVLLRLYLENSRGEIVGETSLLVYVPFQKTNTYSVSLLSREAGNLKVLAEVVSQGRAAVAHPVDLRISELDLIL